MVFLAERRPTTAEMSLARGSNLKNLELRPSWSSLKLNEETLVIYLANYIADWCNGNTGDFDSPIRDSSSLSAAIVAKNIAKYILSQYLLPQVGCKKLVNMEGYLARRQARS